MNKVILKGRLTKDVDLRYTQTDNKAVAKFSIAVNRIGEGTDFFNCVAFGKQAEFVTKYFQKGQEILLNGRIENDKYEDKTYTNIKVEQIEFCGSKPKEDLIGEIDVKPTEDDDDLPF